MAKQKSFVKMSGTLDDLTFAQTKNGYEVRKKRIAVSKETIATDPKYARLRENMSEFNRGASSAKLLRTVVSNAMLNCADKGINIRLTKAMMKVLVSDGVSTRGLRTPANGDFKLLEGFSFNSASQLSSSMKVDFPTNIDRASGKITADIPSFIPEDVLIGSTGATHFRIHSVAADINFTDGTYTATEFESPAMPLGNVATALISIVHNLNAASTNPLLLLIGIRFFQVVNGTYYPLKNGASNALTVVQANNPV